MDEDEDKREAYAWETFEKSWADLGEGDGEDGVLWSSSRAGPSRVAPRDTRLLKRGIIRQVLLVLDLSESMMKNDLKPSRLAVVLSCLEGFLREFFDQNPISALGIVVTHGGVAEKLSSLSGQLREHLRALKKLPTCNGEPSLQNALEVARVFLRDTPSYSCREVVIVSSSLSTCDPGDIFDTIVELKREEIRCSFIGLSAELYVARYLVEQTGGDFGVVTTPAHLRTLLMQQVQPPPSAKGTKTKPDLILMGFPNKNRADNLASLCACHSRLKVGGFSCPRCQARVCDVPTTCPVCTLTLVSSPHLARSYHHLFPVPNYDAGTRSACCHACQQDVTAGTAAECPRCKQVFCFECERYIHESLHTCPGCEGL